MSEAIKKTNVFMLGSRNRTRGVIYDAELAQLLKKGLVKQLVVITTPAGYQLAVLPDCRVELAIRQGVRKVTNITAYNVAREGALLLHSKQRLVKEFRSLDTIVKSVRELSNKPPIITIQ
jgi:hypothetical protein